MVGMSSLISQVTLCVADWVRSVIRWYLVGSQQEGCRCMGNGTERTRQTLIEMARQLAEIEATAVLLGLRLEAERRVRAARVAGNGRAAP